MQPDSTKPQELYPGHAAEAARHEARGAILSEANATPLPGPLLDAFAHVPEEIGGLKIRALVHYDFVLLKKLGSPLLDQLKRGAKSVQDQTAEPQQTTTFSDEQSYEMILQFSRPIEAAAALVEKGVAHFRTTAIREIGMKLGPVESALLVKAIEKEFIRAFSTVIKYVARDPGGSGEGAVFTQPPVVPKTDPAGGSTTSAN